MKNRRRTIRCLLYAAELLILSLLSGTPFLLPEVFGGKPLLLLAAALGFAAAEEETAALILGAVCGALTDLLSYGGVGYYAIALTLVCFALSRLFATRLRANWLTLAVLSLAAVPLLIGVYFVLFRLTADIPDPGTLFVGHYLSRMALTWLFAVPLYVLNRLIVRGFPIRD